MNQVIDLNRWFLLIGKHWSENKKKYLLSVPAIGGLLIIWFLFLILTNPPLAMRPDVQIITYFVGLFLVGLLYASMMFNELSQGPQAMHFLMVPASALEKLLTGLLFSVVLFFVSYTIIFYIADIIMINVANSVARSRFAEHGGTLHIETVANVFTGTGDMANNSVLFYILLVFTIVQSAFLLGSVYFTRFSFIKTAIALLIVFLFFVFYFAEVMDPMMPRGHFYEGLTAYRVVIGNQENIVSIPGWLGDVLVFLIKFSLPPFFWLVTWFRLREKEV